MNAPARVPAGWWLGEGAERCPFCLQSYAVEVEVRCTACDVPGCMHCMVRVRRAGGEEFSCPGCREATPAQGTA